MVAEYNCYRLWLYGEIGRRYGLKIHWPVMVVRVRVSVKSQIIYGCPLGDEAFENDAYYKNKVQTLTFP